MYRKEDQETWFPYPGSGVTHGPTSWNKGDAHVIQRVEVTIPFQKMGASGWEWDLLTEGYEQYAFSAGNFPEKYRNSGKDTNGEDLPVRVPVDNKGKVLSELVGPSWELVSDVSMRRKPITGEWNPYDLSETIDGQGMLRDRHLVLTDSTSHLQYAFPKECIRGELQEILQKPKRVLITTENGIVTNVSIVEKSGNGSRGNVANATHGKVSGIGET